MSLEAGQIIKGKVTGITNFGAFIETEDAHKGMVHISEISRSYVEDISKFLTMGQEVVCKVLSVGNDGKLSLSIKQAQKQEDRKPREFREHRDHRERPKRGKYVPAPAVKSPGDFEWRRNDSSAGSFEDMMSQFKKTSEDKMSDLKRGESRGYSRRGNGSGRK